MSSARNRRRRGEPAIALLTVLLSWVGARVVTSAIPNEMQIEGGDVAEAAAAEALQPLATRRLRATMRSAACCSPEKDPRISIVYDPPGGQTKPQARQNASQAPLNNVVVTMDRPPAEGEYQAARNASAATFIAGEPSAIARVAGKSDNPWSADVWALWRQNSDAAALAPGAASYGRSQAGGVLRYNFERGGRGAAAYLRATTALEEGRDREIAGGFSARPIAAVPIRAAVEVRLNGIAGGSEIRPAAFLVTQFQPTEFLKALRVEAYGQAGYVGGSYRSAFVDGQARVDGKLARTGKDAELRAGLATWGGAQKGAARLDVGPSATLSFRLGEARSRVAVDYRIRVAGAAEPGSGPALTFSAGF